MLCHMCHESMSQKSNMCPHCGHQLSRPQKIQMMPKHLSYEPYLKPMIVGSAVLTALFGVLSLWQISFEPLCFLGASFGILGIILNRYQKEPFSPVLKFSYIIIVFGFMLNLISLITSFTSMFNYLF